MKGAWKNMKEYSGEKPFSCPRCEDKLKKGPWKSIKEYTLLSDHSDVPHVIKDSKILTIITKYM